MLTNQQSYTVSDEFEREVLTPHLPHESPVKSYEQPPGDPCHTLLDWEDSLEERPVVFNIRDYTNCEENSATVSIHQCYNPYCSQYYTIEVCTSSFAPYGSWTVSRRYSEFRQLYTSLRQLATSSDSQRGLRFMLDDSVSFTGNQRQQTSKTKTLGNGALTSFVRESAPHSAPIVFPGRKLFKMSSNVIKQRMVELACKY